MALVCVWAAAVAGCGGSGSSAATDSSLAGDTPSDPQSLLIQVKDLSGGSESEEEPPESCSPLFVLEGAGGATALSPLFTVNSTSVAEAVGIFDTPKEATEAYESLTEEERLNCIGEAIYEATSAKTVNYGKPERLDVGDGGSSVHYSAADESGPRGSTDIVSMKSGPCVAALLVATEGTASSKPVAKEATEAASKLLVDGCAQ